MDLSHITSQSLRRVLNLTERKDKLVELVSELETEIAKVLSVVASPIAKAASQPVVVSRKTSKKKNAGAKTAKPGSLKERILSLLDGAGASGLKVKEIAEKLGAPAGNISVWFSTTGKKITRKVAPGRFASKGASGASAPASTAPAAKTAPARKSRKSAKKPSPLKAKILALLESAGPKGMRVKDIAAKLNLPAGNVSVWISTTGKKLVTKVEPGVYTVKGATPAAATKPAAKVAKPAKGAKKTSKVKKAKK